MSDDRSHDAALRRLARQREKRLHLDDEEVQAVAAARQLDVTWHAIGVAIGVQQPAATRKFRPLLADAAVDTTGMTGDEAVAQLRRIQKARRDVAEAELAAVRHARDVGVAWQRIGDVLGMARSNVVVKYKPLLEGRPAAARAGRERSVRRRS